MSLPLKAYWNISLQTHLHGIYQPSSVDFYTLLKNESSDFKFLKSNLGESRHKNHLHNSAFCNTLCHRNNIFFLYKTIPNSFMKYTCIFHIKLYSNPFMKSVIIIILYLTFSSQGILEGSQHIDKLVTSEWATGRDVWSRIELWKTFSTDIPDLRN